MARLSLVKNGGEGQGGGAEPNFEGQPRWTTVGSSWFSTIVILILGSSFWWGGGPISASVLNHAVQDPVAPHPTGPGAPSPDITSMSRGFAGAAVTLAGPVSRVFGAHAFTIMAPPAPGEILVIAPSSSLALKGGESVSVVGDIKPFDANKFAEEYGMDLRVEGAARSFNGRSVIVASKVSILPVPRALGE